MSYDLDPSLVGASVDGQPSPSRWKRPSRTVLKCGLVVVALVSWFGIRPLRFSFPEIADWLPALYLACLLALFFLFLGDLLFRRWKAVAVFPAIWAMVLLPFYGPSVLPQRLYVEAFRFHASPVEKYLSRCKLIEFTQNGAKQKVGVCERIHLPGDNNLTILYDTTGQLALPVSRRTPEWTQAMGRFSPGKFFTETEGHADHLFGNFYGVFVGLEDMDGATDDYQGISPFRA